MPPEPLVQAGERGVLNIGCTATVEHVVNRYPDGRLDIVITGRRRFEVILLDEEKAYLRTSVSFFDDEEIEAAPVELRAMAIAGLNALRAAEEKEEDMLDKAWGLEATSRLSCQAKVAGEDLVIELPKYTINYEREGGGKK